MGEGWGMLVPHGAKLQGKEGRDRRSSRDRGEGTGEWKGQVGRIKVKKWERKLAFCASVWVIDVESRDGRNEVLCWDT